MNYDEVLENLCKEVENLKKSCFSNVKKEEYLELYDMNMYSDNEGIETVGELINYYNNTPVGERNATVLFLVSPNNDWDKVIYVYANSEFDAVFIADKMMGCYVPNTFAKPVYISILEKGYICLNKTITFEEQCIMNHFSYECENPTVEI